MNITTKQCDFCKKDYRSDHPDFHRFGVLEDGYASRWDMCLTCIDAAQLKKSEN